MGSGNPVCNNRVENSNCHPTYINFMAGYTTPTWNMSAVTDIYFQVNRLDNIVIHSFSAGDSTIRPPSIDATYALDREIPEPASAALLGIGALALLARRRRKPTAV